MRTPRASCVHWGEPYDAESTREAQDSGSCLRLLHTSIPLISGIIQSRMTRPGFSFLMTSTAGTLLLRVTTWIPALFNLSSIIIRIKGSSSMTTTFFIPSPLPAAAIDSHYTTGNALKNSRKWPRLPERLIRCRKENRRSRRSVSGPWPNPRVSSIPQPRTVFHRRL